MSEIIVKVVGGILRAVKSDDIQYLKDEATIENAAVYYKSCVCGAKGTETFDYGTPLKEYTDAEKVAYKPTSLTVTLYDSENSVYGFTWNTQSEPLRPVVQVQKGNSLTDTCEEYFATVEQASSFNENDEEITYYIVKAEISLESEQTYSYRAYDKYVDVGTEVATFTARDTKTTSFSFAHISDSQATFGKGYGGSYFAQTLSQIVDNNDFLLHTGDVVEYSKYEYEWKSMLDDNFSYLSKIPVMAISGNHETTYQNGVNETFKHFNNKLPVQESTDLGYFYSFIYGNAKFIMLNTNKLTSSKLTTEQYEWLIEELEHNTCEWTIVAMHNPMYSVGKYGADSSRNKIALALREQLQGIFAEYNVDVVLQGHDHAISRTYPINVQGNPQSEKWKTINGVKYSVNPNGVIYVMNGPAGDQSRTPYAIDDSLYHYAQSSYARSWADFVIDGNTMKVSVKYYNGSEIKTYQTWGILKDGDEKGKSWTGLY